MVEQDVRRQLTQPRPVLDARRLDLVRRKLKSARTCVAQFDEIRVADAGHGTGPVRRPAAEYVYTTFASCVRVKSWPVFFILIAS